MGTVVNPNSQVYYSGHYWNDLPRVLEYMCENFTGDRKKWWTQDFKERFGAQPFEHALILNCGNGWVEREFIDKGIVKRITAFDYSIDLLRQAQKEKGERAIYYFLADANTLDFAPNRFDLIVNVAALHHVQYINRMCRILCDALKPNGILVNYDYIGPQRNQYSLRHWLRILLANRTLPPYIRKNPLRYPHVPTMLRYDPTEAIHSNLIVESIGRYFAIFERHDTGGGIAYDLLTHNPNLHKISMAELDSWIDRLLALDKQQTQRGQVPPLFSYFLARPNKDALNDSTRLIEYQVVEDRREDWALRHLKMYSYRGYLEVIVHRIYVAMLNSRIGMALHSRVKST